jgi:hypothetical protein
MERRRQLRLHVGLNPHTKPEPIQTATEPSTMNTSDSSKSRPTADLGLSAASQVY